MNRILIVDDDTAIKRSFSTLLQGMGLEVVGAGTGKSALEIIRRGGTSLVFLDLKLPDMNGIKILEQIRDFDENILVIVITGYASVESAVEAIRLGAYEYIKKPFKSDTIKVITKLALEKLKLSRQVESLHLEKSSHLVEDEMVGSCDEMVALGKQIAKIGASDTNILIHGESGVGKDLFLKLVVKMSSRSSAPLIHVNCSAVPENLLESEFFGFEKGSFTGALERKKGLFEQADGGTLHLDEVGDMPLSLQSKLLRVLEEKKVRRIGGVGEFPVDIRIVATTSKNLSTEVADRKFRLDLFYRINTFSIKLPPLRTRGDDILLLAGYWIRKNNLKFSKNVREVSEEARKLFLSYPWPGNVRELKNVIERTMLLLPSEITVLRPEHIPLEQTTRTAKPFALEFVGGTHPIEFDSIKGIDYYDVTENISNVTKDYIIERAMQLSGGNKSTAAKMLNLSRSALWREMEKIKRWKSKERSVSEQ